MAGQQNLLYQIALTSIPNIGPVQAKILLDHYEVRDIFSASKSELSRLNGIGTVRAECIKSFNRFDKVEKEIAFINKYGIRPLFIKDHAYPKRLLNCYDPPILLYLKGKANLNSDRIISVVGTRRNSDYGRQITETLIRGLKDQQVMVVSGLAYGIDAIAHRTALEYNIPTMGVLAHGLDLIYPAQNSSLAKEMIREQGGLITEFSSGTNPDRHNFPSRNRIVAGLSDATIVVETDIRGGSIITAELANNYHRDVFAFPGRTKDKKSTGCNQLIRSNKAILVNSVADLIESMGWEIFKSGLPEIQPKLFVDLTPAEQTIIDILGKQDYTHVDDIYYRSNLGSNVVASAMLNMELNGLIECRPGKLYSIGNPT